MGLGDWNAVCCRGKVETLLPIRQAESVLLSAAFRGFGTTTLGHSALVVMVPVSRRFCVYDVSLFGRKRLIRHIKYQQVRDLRDEFYLRSV